MPFLSYIDLLKKNDNLPLTYGEKLFTLEWRSYRDKIIERDKTTCRKCGIIAYKEWENDFFLTKIPDAEFEEMCKQDRKHYEESPYIDLLTENDSNSPEINELIRSGKFRLKKHPYKNFLVPERVIEIHVHHTYYVNNLMPWEYPIKDLITVCKACHEKIHSTETIHIYSDLNFTSQIHLSTCQRCGGTGYFEEYNHVQNGICFACKGTGFDEISDFCNITF